MRFPLIAFPLLSLAACTAGPDYRGPETSKPVSPGAQFARAPDDTRAQAPAAAAWWTALGDPVLDALETRALAANPGVAVAEARVRQARASLRSERANALPSANASALFVHATLPGVDLGNSDESDQSGGGSQSLNFYNLGFDASWEVDLWGGKRRGVEAARAQFDAAQANVADAQVSLTAEIAQAYVNLRDRQQRIVLEQEALTRQREMLRLTEQRHAQGTASALELEQQRNQVEQGEAALLPLSAERDAYLNALATLAGEAPGALDAMLTAPAAVPLPPAEVAVGDPAALLKRRPDVRAAERQFAAATAKIGVAEAARFPSLSFMGLIGIGGTNPGDLVDLDQLAAIAMPRLSWSFLDFGRNAARVEQAKGAQDEAAAQYRQAVLTALRDSEDALSRFGARRLSVASAARSKASADRTAALMRQRFEAGAATRIQLLDAERQSLSAAQTLSQGTAAMTADYIALQKALGLGWR
ncbi:MULTISPECIES: efflux transporter outer membrane subunit [unclassified Sphingobium]|uniref:efflux transporter outer membrane subunit n=1 Tax=unclassified Sphingobium TaxID=2611147 RepID=UPI00076FF633|nr:MULTISPECIES: efflux transporter outer membrane subunit [unclassified Sphingobium]AMK25365.1 outer membrane protein OprN [Sphingobium sp. TKS]NML88021.1 efflux transporter outer membrane subunit [Sphingobium sp. TB-6]